MSYYTALSARDVKMVGARLNVILGVVVQRQGFMTTALMVSVIPRKLVDDDFVRGVILMEFIAMVFLILLGCIAIISCVAVLAILGLIVYAAINLIKEIIVGEKD